jgi:hypothetical protein
MVDFHFAMFLQILTTKGSNSGATRTQSQENSLIIMLLDLDHFIVTPNLH